MILVSESDRGATCMGLSGCVRGCVYKDYKERSREKKEDSRLRNLRRTRLLPSRKAWCIYRRDPCP